MASRRVQIGDFELDPAAYELRRLGRPVRLERIPMELLLLLVSRRGELVTRAEIIEKLWGSDVYIDTNTAINVAARKVRQALRDDPEKPRFVQTVPGKGYRFIATEDQLEAASSQELTVSEAPVPATIAEVPSTHRSRSRVWMAMAGLLAIAGLLLGLQFRRHAATRPGKIMLVVLPFQNFSDDPRQNYFAEGMTEEMITQLGSLNPDRLGVIARATSMQYQNTHKNSGAIARELGVKYLVEGSVRHSGDRVRVTAQLIQASDQTHLWAGDFDRELSDVLQIQSDIANAIAAEIQITLSQQTRQRLSAGRRVNPEAYEAYLQALQARNQRTKESIERSIAEFNRAVTIDPHYALAYAALGHSYALAPIFAVLNPAEALTRARDASLRAIALDDTVADAHTILGFVKAHYDYDWPGAERAYLRALELNPSSPYAHLFYSNSYLSPLGRHDAAIAEMKKAIELDPLSLPCVSFLGRTYIWARRYDEALEQFQRAETMNPSFVLNHERVAHLYAHLGKYEEAIDEDEKARLLSGENAERVIAKRNKIRRALKARGPRGYWETLLEFSRDKENPPEAYVTPFGVAIVYTCLGDKDKAFEWLNRAYSGRDLHLTEVAIEPALDPLRSDPRFAELLRRVGVLS